MGLRDNEPCVLPYLKATNFHSVLRTSHPSHLHPCIGFLTTLLLCYNFAPPSDLVCLPSPTRFDRVHRTRPTGRHNRRYVQTHILMIWKFTVLPPLSSVPYCRSSYVNKQYYFECYSSCSDYLPFQPGNMGRGTMHIAQVIKEIYSSLSI